MVRQGNVVGGATRRVVAGPAAEPSSYEAPGGNFTRFASECRSAARAPTCSRNQPLPCEHSNDANRTPPPSASICVLGSTLRAADPRGRNMRRAEGIDAATVHSATKNGRCLTFTMQNRRCPSGVIISHGGGWTGGDKAARTTTGVAERWYVFEGGGFRCVALKYR